MTRRARIALVTSGSVALLLAIIAGFGIFAVRSGWLREKIRQRVAAEAEKATGGKVEIAALRLDWKTLTAEIDGLVIHGLEPPNTAPLLSVRRVAIGFKVLSFLERRLNVESVVADSPRAHLIVAGDGSTNLPRPKLRRNASETILALKIGRFAAANGAIALERAGAPGRNLTWSARGRNLSAQISFDPHGPQYQGDLAVAPFDFVWDGVQVAAQVTAHASMEKDRLSVSSATLKTAQSEIALSNVQVNGFTSPVTTAGYSARISLAEADRVFHFVNFQHTGTVNSSGTVRFVSAGDYALDGVVRGSGIGYGPVRNMSVSANLSLIPDKALVTMLVVSALGGELRGQGEVRKLEDFRLRGNLIHFDARLLAALGHVTNLPYDGILSGTFDASGKLREPGFHRLTADAALDISPADGNIPLHGSLAAKYDGQTGTVELGRSSIELPHTRLDVSGVPGQRLDVQFQSHDLHDLDPALGPRKLPARLERNGAVSFSGSIVGPLRDPRIAGHAAVRNADWQDQLIDSAAGDFTAMRTEATVSNMAISAKDLHARVTGSISLTEWKPVVASAVNANVSLADADAAKLLAMIGEQRLKLTGTLTANAQVGGTMDDPHATADLTLTRGRIFDQPFDRIAGRAQYLSSGAQLLTASLDSGRKRLNASLRFDHPDTLTFNISSNQIPLADVAFLRGTEPDLKGMAQLKADGVVRIDSRHFDVLDLNGDIRATGLALGAHTLGDGHLTAETKNGVLTARFDSSVAKSAIHGDGTVRLAGDYPLNGKLTVSNLELSSVAAALRGPLGDPKEWNLDGSAAGDITLNGPLRTPAQITAAVDVTQFEIHPLSVTGLARNIPNLSLRNNGPVHAVFENSSLKIADARFTAPSTDLTLSGAVALNSASPFDFHIDGHVNLGLAQTWNSDLTTSGELVINAGLRGTLTNPDFSGRAEIQNADFHYVDFSNGLTNTNGVIVFNKQRATIQSLTGDSGGGKLNATGFVSLTDGLVAFRFEAKTRNVRVRYPAGVSTISDADITLAGTTARSQAAGTVVVKRVSINPRSDMSAVLAGAAQPMRIAAANAGFLANMNLDVQIQTSPDVAFETSVAQSLDADANLRLRGTGAAPAVLGRINVTQGELVFFGNKYTINQGLISFSNPARIDPVLNVDLETRSRGVDVTITVNGSINNLHASYRSDPPLQFADIVALLATGRSPTDTTVATQNTGQSQNLQQLGASALLGEAISSPVGGPLQRFFGVSKVKLDPQLTGITGIPEARLTVEQQVSPEILFTYITDVSSTSTQLIRVEWDFSRKWAAIVTRDENGYVGVDFAFRKRFK